jgi:threonine-phosphate decarboxylase
MRVNRVQNIKHRTQNTDKKSLGSDIEHGGNIYQVAEELGLPLDRIIDFSASINPLGVSEKVIAEIKKELKCLHNYPDPDTKELREKVAQFYDIDPETILCSNGSTELIYLIPRVLKPERVLIPSPTFLEYERAVLSSQGSVARGQELEDSGREVQIKYLNLKEEDGFKIKVDEFIAEMKGDDSDIAFLCNPNNPTGCLLRKDDVLKIAKAAREVGCVLIIDEAFIDFQPEDSVIRDAQDNPYLIVLRSMTKFYALTGLRIGYGVSHPDLIKKLKEFKEPWTVNSLAQKAAIAALEDENYRTKTLKVIETEKGFLEEDFKRLGIRFFPSSANFYLLKINNAGVIVYKLKQRGILIRDCSNFKGLDGSFVRIAVKSRDENKTLINNLEDILDRHSEKEVEDMDKKEFQ